MKFSCIKKNLAEALLTAERFTGKNPNLPALGTLLLETNNDNLNITATNLESAVQLKINGKALKSGKINVPAKTVSSLVQTIPEEKIDLEEKQNSLFIKTSAKDIRLNGFAAEDFPILPKFKKNCSFSVEAAVLANGLEKVLPAVSVSEFKPELSGVFFKVSGNNLTLAATDTFRLAEKTVSLEGKNKNEAVSFILPQRMAAELARIGKETEDEIEISLGDNYVLFETDGFKIISRLIDGSFPEYKGIVPQAFQTSSFVERENFLNTVSSSGIFASKLQDVFLEFKGQNLEINSANSEIGEYKTVLASSTSGQNVKLSFNFRFLLDGIRALDESEIFIGLNSENSPSLLRNKNDSSFLYVLMPIRLS